MRYREVTIRCPFGEERRCRNRLMVRLKEEEVECQYLAAPDPEMTIDRVAGCAHVEARPFDEGRLWDALDEAA